MKIFYLTLCVVCYVFVSLFASAGEMKKKHISNANTVHIKIEMGEFFGLFAKNTGEIKIEMATKNAYGFDGQPMTDIEKAEIEKIDHYLKNNIADIVAFQKLNCTYKIDEIEKNFYKKMDNATGVINTKYNLKCDDNLFNHHMKLNFTAFKGIEQIRVQIKSAETSSQTIDSNKANVNLN